mgnify:FL=1
MFSEQEEASFCARFDSYCHTVLRNAIRNYTKHISIQEKYEFLAECPETYVKKSCMRRDVYEGDHLYVVYRNRSYQLDNELLLQAMQSLQERELGVLILGFWLEWTDLKIAKELQVTDRTVRNIRSRAFEKIKKWLSLVRESTW